MNIMQALRVEEGKLRRRMDGLKAARRALGDAPRDSGRHISRPMSEETKEKIRKTQRMLWKKKHAAAKKP